MLPLCSSNAHVLLHALARDALRLDGRSPHDFRRINIFFRNGNGNVEVSLGRTRCICQVTAAPFALLPTDRASEGDVSFRVSLSPCLPAVAAELAGATAAAAAAAAAEGSSKRNRSSSAEMEKEIERMLRQLLRDSGVVDTEALCIQASKWAWHVRACVTILDDDGNLIDACMLAAVCGLLHFRKHAVTLEGGQPIVHSAAEREPLPLCIHHLPVLVSFSFFPPTRSSSSDVAAPGSGWPAAAATQQLLQAAEEAAEAEEAAANSLVFVVDPSAPEEAFLPGRISVAVSGQGELCGVYKVGGPALRFPVIQSFIKMATQHAKKILATVNAAADEEKQRRKRLQRENAISRYDEACVTLSLPASRTLPAGDAAAAAVFPTLRQKAAAATLHTAAAMSLKTVSALEAAEGAPHVPAGAASAATPVTAPATGSSSNERDDGSPAPAAAVSPALNCMRATPPSAGPAAPAPLVAVAAAAAAGAVQSEERSPAACKAGKTPANAGGSGSPFVKSKKARKVK